MIPPAHHQRRQKNNSGTAALMYGCKCKCTDIDYVKDDCVTVNTTLAQNNYFVFIVVVEGIEHVVTLQ